MSSRATDYQKPLFKSSGQGAHLIKRQAREAFVDWLATPLEKREPPTLIAFARLHGVATSTLKGWKNDARFQLAANERLAQRVDFDTVPGVIRSLEKQAQDPDSPRSVSAARALLDYLKWSLPTEAQGSIDVKSMSDEDLRLAMLAAVDEMDARDAKPKPHTKTKA